MGQAMGAAQCTGNRNPGESGAVPGRPGQSKFLQEAIAQCGDSGVVDRFDLTTYMTQQQFEETVKADQESANWQIFVDSKANVWVRPPGDSSELPGGALQSHKFDLPALAEDYMPFAHGIKNRYIVRASCDDNPNVPPLAKPCETESAIVDLLCEVLRLGAESLDVTIGQEMLIIDFDKVALMEDYEKRGGFNKPGLQVITSFAWMAIDKCRLVPGKDPLKTSIMRMKAGRGTKTTLVKEMRKNGTEEQLCRLFLAATGPGPTGDKMATVAEQYLTVMMQTAKDREFEMSGASTEGEMMLLSDCVSEMVERVQDIGRDVKSWQMCVGSEAVLVRTAQEAMMQAERSKATGKNQDYIRYAMRAASFALQEMQALDIKVANDPKLVPQHVLSWKHQESLVSAGKALVDTMLTSLETGNMLRDSFEQKFSELCDTMVMLCDREYADYMRLPVKQLPREQLILCMRQKADYLRYLYLYVPSRRRGLEPHIRGTYEEAIGHTSFLPSRKLAGISVYVNCAMFHAEVKRDSTKASRVLNEGMACMDRRHPPSDKEAAEVCNPAQVLTWKLMLSNSEAFQSRILILQVRFHLDGWKVHAVAEGIEGTDQAALPDEGSTGSLSARRTVLRGVDAWNAAHVHPREIEVDPQARAGLKENNVDSAKDIQRVVRWVRSRPLCRNTMVAKEEDAPVDLLHQVRWIEHVELPPRHQDRIYDKDATHATRCFLVGCVVRLTDDPAVRRRNEDAWSEQFIDELQTDESERHANVGTKEIVVPSQTVMHAITDVLDAEGVVQGPKEIQGVKLNTGDILGQPHDMQDMELKEVVKKMRSTDATMSFPKTIFFLPCLQVFDVRVVESGPYTDVHTHFTGFPGGDAVDGKLLRRSARFSSFAGIITDLRMINPRSMRGENPAPNPRRIPGMSARRSPFQAVKRGCK